MLLSAFIYFLCEWLRIILSVYPAFLLFLAYRFLYKSLTVVHWRRVLSSLERCEGCVTTTRSIITAVQGEEALLE